MADIRDLLTDYVNTGKARQLSTLDTDGAPYVSNLWFAGSFDPDRLYFISRPQRRHCENTPGRPRGDSPAPCIDVHQYRRVASTRCYPMWTVMR